MSDAFQTWYGRQHGDVPPSLEARMRHAVNAADHGVAVTALSHAASDCLRAALDAGEDRAAATHLLAADALLTAACELAVDSPQTLNEVADRFAPHRIGDLFPGALPPAPG